MTKGDIDSSEEAVGPREQHLQGEDQRAEAACAPAASGALFSVPDVAAITQFVTRGLYRNFELYRACFLHEAKYLSERRVVQVDTPLTPLPLSHAELI